MPGSTGYRGHHEKNDNKRILWLSQNQEIRISLLSQRLEDRKAQNRVTKKLQRSGSEVKSRMTAQPCKDYSRGRDKVLRGYWGRREESYQGDLGQFPRLGRVPRVQSAFV